MQAINQTMAVKDRISLMAKAGVSINGCILCIRAEFALTEDEAKEIVAYSPGYISSPVAQEIIKDISQAKVAQMMDKRNEPAAKLLTLDILGRVLAALILFMYAWLVWSTDFYNGLWAGIAIVVALLNLKYIWSNRIKNGTAN